MTYNTCFVVLTPHFRLIKMEDVKNNSIFYLALSTNY